MVQKDNPAGQECVFYLNLTSGRNLSSHLSSIIWWIRKLITDDWLQMKKKIIYEPIVVYFFNEYMGDG